MDCETRGADDGECEGPVDHWLIMGSLRGDAVSVPTCEAHGLAAMEQAIAAGRIAPIDLIRQ